MISYFGGKSNMTTFINKYICREAKIYSEPFSGAFWTYISPNYQFQKLDKIIYNDFNGHMSNLYSCMTQPTVFSKKLEDALSEGGFLYTDKTDKDEVREFYKEIYYKYKHDKSEGNFLDNPPSNRPDFDAGIIYSFLITSAFNGCHPRSAGCSPISSNLKPKITALLNKLKDERYIEKLTKITDVHNEDFEEIFKKYDSPETFFYVDPPYFSPNEDGKDTAKRASWYGTKDFNYESHIRILNILKNSKGKWALSYYYFKELEDLLPKDKYTWVQKDFYRSSASFAEGEQQMGTELLIMNYKLTDEELEENEKFLNLKSKSTKTKSIKTNKNVSDKFIDEIEKENGGAFIASEKAEILTSFAEKLISSQVDIDPEFVEIVNDNFDELAKTKKLDEEWSELKILKDEIKRIKDEIKDGNVNVKSELLEEFNSKSDERRKEVSEELLNIKNENNETYLSKDWVKENILKNEEEPKDDEIDDFWN